MENHSGVNDWFTFVCLVYSIIKPQQPIHSTIFAVVCWGLPTIGQLNHRTLNHARHTNQINSNQITSNEFNMFPNCSKTTKKNIITDPLAPQTLTTVSFQSGNNCQYHKNIYMVCDFWLKRCDKYAKMWHAPT